MRSSTKTTTWERTAAWPKGLLRHVKTTRFYGRFTLGGKTKFIPLDTTILEIARQRFSEHKARVERGRKAARSAQEGTATMGELLLLERQAINRRVGIADGTREILLGSTNYIEKTWPNFATLRPDEVNATSILKWRDHALSVGTGYMPPGAKSSSEKTAGKSGSTFNKAFDTVRRMLNRAVDAGAINANPLVGRRGLKAKDTPHKPQLPEAAKLRAVFEEIESVGGKGVETAIFCRFLTYTGCRISEAAAVRWKDVDFVRGILHANGTKTSAAKRDIPLSKSLRELLLRIKQRRHDALAKAPDVMTAIDPTASVLAVSEAQKSLTRACAKVGIDRLTHHDLRDVFTTTCIEAGVDVPTVAAWLGHKDGGALLMRVYAHHRRAHSVAQMQKVIF